MHLISVTKLFTSFLGHFIHVSMLKVTLFSALLSCSDCSEMCKTWQTLLPESLCHELSLCGSLRSPPEGTVTRVLTVINSISHIPVPVADSMHRCSILTLVYLSCASHHLIAKSCFAMQPFLSVYPVYDSPCMTWTLILRRLPTLILPALFTDYPECLPPAPIQSLSSDSDSALKLVIKLCLSDLHTLLIKLHVDPNAPDSSLHLECENLFLLISLTEEYSSEANELKHALWKHSAVMRLSFQVDTRRAFPL